MEGLIPLVYKAIKKSRTRKQYECLSSGSALTYNVEDFFISGGDQGDAFMTPQADKVSSFNGHRRHKSLGGKRVGGGGAPPGKQLVRFRSHKLFSCVTGA